MDRKRSTVSLLTAFSFVVLAATGVLAFALPFSLRIVGLHSLVGFVFIGFVALHVLNNREPLQRYLRKGPVLVTVGVVSLLAGLFAWQPAPIKRVLGLSRNLGPAIDRFEITHEGMRYDYVPDAGYRIALTVRTGASFDSAIPPRFAIWLENASEYHIKTLHGPADTVGRAELPYWDFKRRGWEKASRDAARRGRDVAAELGVDAITAPSKNSSFDPADYILPKNPQASLPYRLLLEINQPDDGQASLVYAVDVDNASPRTFQLLSIVGYPKRAADDARGRETWNLHHVDDRFGSALALIDSGLLTIERGSPAP